AAARALGGYQVPQQSLLAQRAAEALRPLVSEGDVSYLVERAAAEALGRTRVAGVLDVLQQAISRPSWQAYVQQGIFKGLACCGDERAIPLLLDYLDASRQPPLWRLAATHGLQVLARERHLYREAAWQQAVTRLCEAVEHDPWEAVRQGAALALLLFGERRAVPALERAAARELETRVLRSMRAALYVLRSAGQTEEQLGQLRQDLEALREENRRLKEQLASLETRLTQERTS
ncbi:MAG: HEAT repeat domain-containing protein, partial [Thermogemmatispora sp.]|uniref:HEAT repeat domain-containing protein n=1 Tax=Thermogemmatispora sp. TaxID=1968838 RepID=UPI0019EF77BC